MRARTLKLFVLTLLAVGILPLAGDAAIPVPPASQAACCNTADQIPSPAPVGDEVFFSIPGGVPNVMVMMDTSGSMFGLPQDITYPAWSADNSFRGTCSGHWLNAHTPFNALGAPDTTRVPFDNGYNTTGDETIDAPPWGLPRCTAKQARPAGDAALDYCLFRPDSYYKATGSADSAGGWDSSTTRVYNANPCGAISSNNGAVQTNYLGAPVLANNLAQCQSCLATAGFYVMNPRRQTALNSWTNTTNQVVFAGWFLNAYPPKYVAARKVVKDLVRLDGTVRPHTDLVRFGLTVFNGNSASGYSTSLRAGDGGTLVVPLGPNCDESFPVNRTAFATSRQALINAVNTTRTATDWSDTLYVNFGGNTPLSETLFNIGQYYSNTGSSALYPSLFTTSWVRSTFNENAAGSVNASWAAAGKNQHSFCWACQQSSVVVVTDGAPNADSNLPASTTPSSNHSTFNNDFRKWSNSTVDCPTCGNDLSGSPANTMHKVAYFMSQTDLRPDLANGSRPQTVSTYTISFGINATTDPAAVALLKKTADLGNGIFANSSSAEELANALDTAVSDVVQRSTSFSSANANSLQTSKTSGVDSYLGRFRPNSSAFWEGHLFAAGIFDEFGEGCDEQFGTSGQKTFQCGRWTSKNPNIDGDEDPSTGKAICKSAYVIDSECDPVIEDGTGNFKKGVFDAVTHQLLTTPDDALLFWDAGRVLSDPTKPGYRSADENATDKRTIYTVIDVNGDGKFTAADGMVEFSAANAAALAPLMNLDALAQTSATTLPTVGSTGVTPWCNTWLNSISVCGKSPLPACPNTATGVRTKCAEQIIHFYRGWDVMDWDGDHCAAPGNYYNTNPGWATCTTSAQCGGTATCSSGKCLTTGCPNGEQRDRVNDSRAINAQEFWKLGDIFHSAPVLVKAPADKFRCKIGIDNQCLLTLFSALGSSAQNTTPLAKYGSFDAYDQMRYEKLNINQMVVVGANDGMLHAFDAGGPDTSKPANVEGQYPLTSGTGGEVWAFVPPEMLPHLKDGLAQHHYFVDGNTMVRDVWYDVNGDGTKQKDEFRTVAVITERGGGTHFTALDITDRGSPRFLWTFPQPCSEDSQLAGQTWSLFPPRPPPILPVRLKVASGSGRDPLNRGFEERWIVALNGGFDPTLVRGRVVWIVDAITGQVLWRFTDADFKKMRGDNKASMLPVAATIGGMDIGKADQAGGIPDTDGYFDTLTWGDVGGNVFVARIHEPGEVDPGTGLVTNWTAARTFEPNRKSDDTHVATGRGEFFYMTSNFLSGASRLLTMLGSGNQEQLMQTGSTCGPNDVLGCCASGCTLAKVDATSSYGGSACNQGGTFQCSAGLLTYTPATTTGCGAGFTCGTTDQTATLTFDCGTAGKSPPAQVGKVTCGSDGICTTDTPFLTASGHAVGEFSTAILGQPLPPNRQFAIWSYGKEAWKLFKDAAGALAFDQNRFTDVPYSGCGGVGRSCQLVETSSARTADLGDGMGVRTTCRDGTSKCWSDDTDNGWMYSYGRWCPLSSCSPATWTDEKTGSAPSVFRGCSEWSGFRPVGGGGGTDPCSATLGTPTSIRYRTDAKSGVPREFCGTDGTLSGRTAFYAGLQKNAYAPPQSGSIRVVVNAKGQVSYSTLKIETGSPAEKQSLGTRSSISDPLYWLEVPREVHSCRHVDPTTCQ